MIAMKKVLNYSTSIPVGVAINEIQDLIIIILLQRKNVKENIRWRVALEDGLVIL